MTMRFSFFHYIVVILNYTVYAFLNTHIMVKKELRQYVKITGSLSKIAYNRF